MHKLMIKSQKNFDETVKKKKKKKNLNGRKKERKRDRYLTASSTFTSS